MGSDKCVRMSSLKKVFFLPTEVGGSSLWSLKVQLVFEGNFGLTLYRWRWVENDPPAKLRNAVFGESD